MEVKLKDTYYVTHSWMFKLGLKGLEREIFSIIYGFSQGNAGSFHSSLDYLANLTGYHRDSCCRALNSLHKKKYLHKKEYFKGSFKHCIYKVNIEICEIIIKESESNVVSPSINCESSIDNSSTIPSTNCESSIGKLSINNKDNKTEKEKEERLPFEIQSTDKDSIRKHYVDLIIKACSNFAIGISELHHIDAFRSEENKNKLYKYLDSAKYDIEQCIDLAHRNIKKDIETKKIDKPIFEFRSKLYTYLINGNGAGKLKRIYTKEEIETHRQAKENKIREQKVIEYKEDLESKIETDKYNNKTSTLFGIPPDEIPDLIEELGMFVFLTKRKELEESYKYIEDDV